MYHKNESTLDDGLKAKIKLKIHTIARLCNLMKSLFRHQTLYDDWIFHHNFKTYFPDIYDSIKRKNIDPMIAYKWCLEKPETNENRKFMNKLLSIVTANEYYNWENQKTTNAESAFIKELVRMISRYQSSSTIMRALHNKNAASMKQAKEASEKFEILDAYVRQLNQNGAIAQLSPITEIESTLQTSVLPLTSVDGNGVDGRIFIDGKLSDKVVLISPGREYVTNEIVKVTVATGIHMATFKEYFFKVVEIFYDKENSYFTKVSLNNLTAFIPQWTRIYMLLFPGTFNLNMIYQIKQDLENYGLQYVLMKYQQTVAHDFDAIVSTIQT